MSKIEHLSCGLTSLSFTILCAVITLILLGSCATSWATLPRCISNNAGEIRDRHGAKIRGLSGITRRAPGDVYLISDRTNILYHARFLDGRWHTDHYGIDSEGSGPNRKSIQDIEDVTYGPCPNKSEGQCIFIGQIGANRPFADKNTFYIHYIRERDMAGQRGRYVRTTKIKYHYPNGGRFDAEGLAAHPRTGDLFVVTKTRGSTSYIYKFNPRFPNIPPKCVVEIDLSTLFGSYEGTNARQITGLEISPDGSRFAIVTYEGLVEFKLDLSRTKKIKLPDSIPTKIRALISERWPKAENLRDAQIEAITYDGSNSRFLVIGEGDPAVMALDCSKWVPQKKSPAGPGCCADPTIPVDAFLTGYDRLYGGGGTSFPMKGEYACTGRGTYSRVTPLRITDYECDPDFTNCREVKRTPVIKREFKENKILFWVSDRTWWEKELKTAASGAPTTNAPTRRESTAREPAISEPAATIPTTSEPTIRESPVSTPSNRKPKNKDWSPIN